MMCTKQQAFFELVRAGLWEKKARLSQFGKVDCEEVMRLAEEQSLVGLITAGLEHVVDVKAPKDVLLQLVGQTLQLEQQNTAMNYFIGILVDKMRKSGIYTLLVKGQGVAQCYERPLWRSCGDVDLFLNDDNYKKAKAFLSPMASEVENGNRYEEHLAMTIDSWIVELHGNLRCGLCKKIDIELDAIKKETFYGGDVSSWINGHTHIFKLSENNDAIYVFTHILSHFYKGGIGLRQICDWCRLLYINRDKINHSVLQNRIQKMGLLSEWKSFGAFAVEYLGMPKDSMPFYSPDAKWKRKADKICAFIMEVGNFGHNRDMSYYSKYPYCMQKVISMGHRCGDLLRHARIFPLDSLRFFPYMILIGVKETIRWK